MPSLSASLPRSLRKPLNAAVGLSATVADRAKSEAKQIPERLVALPVTMTSTALQVAMRARQKYAALADRGAEVLHHEGTAATTVAGTGEAGPVSDDDLTPPTPLRAPSKFDAVEDGIEP